MKFTPEFLIVVKTYNIEIYAMPPLRLLGDLPSKSSTCIMPFRSVMWPKPVWRAIILNTHDQDRPNCVSIVVRSQGDRIHRYSLDQFSSDYETKCDMSIDTRYHSTHDLDAWCWITQLCPGSSGSRVVWMTGNSSHSANTELASCTFDARPDATLNETETKKSQIIWRLPGGSCADVSHHMIFDDAVGIIVIATAQGHVWVVDYG